MNTPADPIKRKNIAKYVADKVDEVEKQTSRKRTKLMDAVRSVLDSNRMTDAAYPLADINVWLAGYHWHGRRGEETEHGKFIKKAFAQYTKSVCTGFNPLPGMFGQVDNTLALVHPDDDRALQLIECMRAAAQQAERDAQHERALRERAVLREKKTRKRCREKVTQMQRELDNASKLTNVLQKKLEEAHKKSETR